MFLTHILSALALLATLVFASYSVGILTEDEMLAAYEPFAWMCLQVPGIVECNEQS